MRYLSTHKTSNGMMRKCLSLIVLLLGCMTAYPQTGYVQKYEFELCAGLSMPLGSFHHGSAQPGATFGLSFRRNLEDSPWDFGLELQLYTSEWELRTRELKEKFSQNNRTLVSGVSAGYNFRQGSRFNPFASITVGYGNNDVVDNSIYPVDGNSFAFVPKVGIELLSHIRLTAFCLICRPGFHTYGLTLGAVIGGRPKKIPESY